MNWGAVPLAGVSRHFSRGQIGCSHLGINSPAVIKDIKIVKRLMREALRTKTTVLRRDLENCFLRSFRAPD